MVEIPLLKLLRIATKLRVSFPRRDLKIKVSNPFGDPAHFAKKGGKNVKIVNKQLLKSEKSRPSFLEKIEKSPSSSSASQ